MTRLVRCTPLMLIAVSLSLVIPSQVSAQSATPSRSTSRPEYPPFETVAKGYTKVTTNADGVKGLYTLWKRDKDGQMLAELPRSYATDKYFFAMTVQSGEQRAGLQSGERYLTWRRYDKRLALVEPNISVRSTGEQESRDSVKRLFTDRVMLDVPIVCLSPSKAPVIDLDALLVGQARSFFGFSAFGVNPRLIRVKTAKSFPQNIEVAFEAPTSGGRLKTFHYSISKIPSSTGYKPRKADERVGFFTTSYRDLGKYKDDETTVRLINRWHLEKADPKLKLSPPKQPIVFYIEHTTPKRYRHWVKQGILLWNKAFERVGLRDAIVVYQQDSNKAIFPNHMEKDPEDVRYNFVRWLNNDEGTAIGPSRVHPMTGQILDADIILTDGWIRHYEMQYDKILPKLAMEGYGAETLAWLNQHPNWDPRILLTNPSERPRLLQERIRTGALPFGGHPMANVATETLGDDQFDGIVNRFSQKNGLCLAADGKGFDLAVMRMTLDMLAYGGPQDDEEEDGDDEEEDGDGEEDDAEDDDKKKKDSSDVDGDKKESGDGDEAEGDREKDDEKKDAKKKDGEGKSATKKEDGESEKKEKAPKKPAKEEGQKLDGIPEEFIGPLVMELVAHEVGHTLGLRHNFKASSVYTLEQIRKKETNGGPLAGSVMDYLPINMQMKEGKIQGDHTMKDIGPYDMWAIEYGYTFSSDLKKVLSRVAEPELVYGTDEDTFGPDPRARLYDFGHDPLDYAKNQMKLAKYHRKHLLKSFVKEGESWSKARRGYELSLSLQTRSLSMMANWIGGTYLNRDKKGDKDARDPVTVVSVEKQRAALDWVLENAFRDEAFGLTPKLIRHLSVDQWGSFLSAFEADFPVHDRVMGIQSATLTMLMNPSTLRLVYDNELRSDPNVELLTLPELLDAISDEIWSELKEGPEEKATARKPWLSSLRRNLQQAHLQRLVDLTLPDAGGSAAYKPISNLAVHQLRKIQERIDELLKTPGNMDAYSLSHLNEASLRIEKALDADYIYNTDALGGGGFGGFFFLKEPPKEKESR